MIVIVNKDCDFFANNVINWLLSHNVIDIVKIDENDELFIENINQEKIIISINGQRIDFNNIKFFWYQGGVLPMPKQNWIGNNKEIDHQVRRFINYEWKVLQDFIFFKLQQKPHIGNYFLAGTNKLRNLCIAKDCGLLIPDTYVAQNDFSMKIKSGYRYIVKPLGESIPFTIDEKIYRLYTQEIEVCSLKNNNQKYFPSLLQNKIDIDFEIRVFTFYEYREFYAMAIFNSQFNAVCDYRNTAYTNRYAPYDLPKKIKDKLLLFMEKMQLDTASFDLIKTRNGEFVFLEVNPFGNIEMINETCGYGIDRRYAEIIYNKLCKVL